MLKTYLMENYGYNEPIFLNDLTIQGLSENAVRQAVKRLVANGFLERYDNGIYYFTINKSTEHLICILDFFHNLVRPFSFKNAVYKHLTLGCEFLTFMKNVYT